jgi:osmotically-inducible protein OsmY
MFRTSEAIMNKKLSIISLAVAGALASVGAQADSSKFTGEIKDAWLTGKIETVLALNAQLNPFKINTDVEGGVVHLTGLVEDDADRDLAGEIAKGIDGVIKVDNDLEIDEERAAARADQDGRDFGSWVDDTTTTAVVKSKLLGNGNTSGLKIDVDTADDVVTLSGRVESSDEKNLAEQIARNTGDVRSVRNHLVVDPS